MHKINITTKKFSEAVTIDLGQLPTVDARIDFILTDGTNPVIAENKTFTLTIGTVEGTLYKTDEDTVSFRYLKFNSGNVSSTLPITIKMEGIEILNDTVSLTYQTSGGGGSVQVDTGLNESSPNPVANSTLTPIINGKADKATTIAGYGITDAYTKTEVDAKVTSVYRYKGTVSTYADLPSSGQEVGDVWNNETADSAHGIKAGDNVAWNGTTWDALAGEIDLSAYATKTELATVATTGSYNDLTNRPDLTTKLDAPAVAGTVGQVLTKTADGQEWDDLPDTTDYLCFTASQANSTVRLDRFGTPPTINLEYSVDKKTWTEYNTWNGTTGATITLANIGDSVWWRGNNTAFSLDLNNAYRFTMSGSIEASGNVMSLLDKTCKSVTIPTTYCFLMLFGTCASLKKAPELPATTLANWCYYGTFYGCSSLIEAPELPATTLAEHCYDWMFCNCSSLIKAPELPATTMVNGCYKQMFQKCTSLQKAPELPATKLENSCYSGMFMNCTSLREAPELPASSVVDYCYENMFNGCNKLEKIKASFSEWRIGTSGASKLHTENWLLGASPTGVFEFTSSFTVATRDTSHVPAGWTIVYSCSPQSMNIYGYKMSGTQYWIRNNLSYTPVVTAASAITLNASTLASTDIAYAEVVLDVATGATVTAGSNMTLVDTPTAGKRNICVCRWSGGVCKLYITIVEDLPQA